MQCRVRKLQFDILESKLSMSTIGPHTDSMVIIGTPPPNYIPPIMWTPPFTTQPYVPYYAGVRLPWMVVKV